MLRDAALEKRTQLRAEARVHTGSASDARELQGEQSLSRALGRGHIGAAVHRYCTVTGAGRDWRL